MNTTEYKISIHIGPFTVNVAIMYLVTPYQCIVNVWQLFWLVKEKANGWMVFCTLYDTRISLQLIPYKLK